ncbi:MAG: hypothetical protein DSZ24_06380 [Thermodesulfatator sp.]|nr:MAG: hypothetical protein DSZ24_06380 [Thermodesulfatator sp.]
MRVITPAPVTFLPENLVPLFSQPGRELTVRVIEVEGKTLTLETGGERFQARLAHIPFAEALRPGETLRVRVVSTSPSLLIHLIEEEGAPSFLEPGRELTVRVIGMEGRTLILESEGERFPARLAPTLGPEVFRPGEALRVRVLSTGPPVLLQLVEGREGGPPSLRLEPLLALLPQKAAEVFPGLPAVSEREDLPALVALVVKALEEHPGREEISPRKEEGESHLPRDLQAVLSHILSEGVLVLPFVFADRLSWGLLEAREREEAGEGASFYLRLFLSELGLVEVLMHKLDRGLRLHFYFSREEALKLAREAVAELRGVLLEKGWIPEIVLEKGYYEPGVILAKEG